MATRGDCEGTSRAAIEPALRQEHSVPNADPGDPRSIVRRSTPVAPKPKGHPRTFVTRNRRARGGLAESDPTAPPCTQVRSRECIVRKSPRRIHRVAPTLDRASNQPRDGRPHRRGALPGTLAPGVGFPFFGKSTFRREKKFPRFTPPPATDPPSRPLIDRTPRPRFPHRRIDDETGGHHRGAR